MLFRFDPYRDLDRLAQKVLGDRRVPQPMPMDCYRQGDTFFLTFDLPGIDTDSLEVVAEHNTLTVTAQRHTAGPEDATYLVAERPAGSYSRQLVVGDGADLDGVVAGYHDGVLTLTIPVAEQAKPRRVDVTHGKDSTGPAVASGPKTISGTAVKRNHLVGATK
jgi:HSP20 family protein